MKKRILVLFIMFLLVFTPINFSYTALGATEDLSTYTEQDIPGRISLNTNGSQVNISGMRNDDDNVYLVNDLESSNGLQATDWSVSFEIYSPPTTTSASEGCRLLGCSFSDGLGDVAACGTVYWCGFYITTNSPYQNRMRLGKGLDTGKSGAVTLSESTWYYAYFNRSDTYL
ncbi:MAG: hypothetical protein GWN93_10030, partial [Deltaproteobacteria bacterium]|nr:hypothetical protein [Deltaproteobacteria bacterium]